MCAAYSQFAADLARLTPHGSQLVLVADAQDVQSPLFDNDVTLDAAGQRLLDDVGTLVEHVESSKWPTVGTPVDPEITDIGRDCASI